MPTFLELQQEVASRVRLDITNQSELATLVKRWLNLSQQEIWAAYDWPWALDREIVQTVADVTTGTVSVSAGGTTVTGSSTAFSSADVGKFIQFSSSDDWYKVSAYTSSTSIDIEAPYVGTSALSAGTYTLRKMLYSTSSSVEKIMSVRQSTSPTKLTLVPFRTFDSYRPRQDETSNPMTYVLWGYDSSSRWTFSLDPVPNEVMNLEVRFKKKHTDLSLDADLSLIPSKWHYIIGEGALYRALEYARTSDDDKRAEFKKNSFDDMVRRMKTDCEPESDYAPRLGNNDVSFARIGPRLPDDFGVR